MKEMRHPEGDWAFEKAEEILVAWHKESNQYEFPKAGLKKLIARALRIARSL